MIWPTLILSWDQFNDASQSLAVRLRERLTKRQIAGSIITGIPRGGLPLAVTLSHLLDVTFISIDSVSPFSLGTGPNCCGRLIVADDIIDTGKTYDYYRRKFGEIDPMFVAWAGRRGSQREAVLAGLNIPEKVWVIFPWEDKAHAEHERDEFLRSRGLVA